MSQHQFPLQYIRGASEGDQILLVSLVSIFLRNYVLLRDEMIFISYFKIVWLVCFICFHTSAIIVSLPVPHYFTLPLLLVLPFLLIDVSIRFGMAKMLLLDAGC